MKNLKYWLWLIASPLIVLCYVAMGIWGGLKEWADDAAHVLYLARGGKWPTGR